MTDVVKLQYMNVKIHFSRSVHFMFLIVKMFALWDFASKYLSMSIHCVKFQILCGLSSQFTSQKVE